MKTSKSIKLVLCLLIPILILVNCDKTDDSPSNVDSSEIMGTFTIKTSLKQETKINLSAKNLTLEEILQETRVIVNNSEGTEVLNELYPDLPDPITLPVGNYRLFMERLGDVRPSFDNPTYVNTEFHSGGAALAISKNTETEVNGILVLDHIKVVVDFSDEVLQAYPDLVADVFDPDPADATPEAEKLRWSAAENGTSGYVFIDHHGAALKVSLSATDGNTGQALSATKTFPGASYNQKYHLSIELSENDGTSSLSIDPSILPEDVIEEVIPFPVGEVICSSSGMGDYEILKKLSEANLFPDESGDLRLPWDLADTRMLSWDGVTLDTEGRVTEIDIDAFGIPGDFVLIPEFGQLCRLVRLRLHDLYSSSLGIIGQLSSLEYLTISESNISVPSEIGMLNNLKELLIANGGVTDLPPEIGQLSNLERLVLSSLFIEALPLEIGQLTNLKYLDVSNNDSGEMLVPPEVGNLNNLEELYLEASSLNVIPKELGQLSNLRILDLNSNQLTSIPEELGQLSNLTFMGLSSNPVIDIPQVVCDLDDADTEIRLDDGSSPFYPEDVCK